MKAVTVQSHERRFFLDVTELESESGDQIVEVFGVRLKEASIVIGNPESSMNPVAKRNAN